MACCAETATASQLLATWQNAFHGGSGLPGYTAIRFHIANAVELGVDQAPYWHDGDVGSFDFTSANATNYAEFVQQLTNGVNDPLGAEGHFLPAGGYCVHWTSEYFAFGGSDLNGYEIDTVRLVVNELHMWADEELFHLDAHLTWQFIGNVPEPNSLVLASLMLTVRVRRRTLRCQVSRGER